MTARQRWGASVDLAIGALVLAWVALVATQGQGRWPWVGFVILAAGPFLLLPAPAVLSRARDLLAGRPRRVWIVMAAAAAIGIALHALTGTARWYYLLLWPSCALGATAAADVGREGEPPAGRLLLVAVLVAILAGVWDPTLQARVPGTIDLGLPYFAALDMALLLLLVARPLATLDMRYDLEGRDVAAAAVAIVALLVVALPVGYATGFLHFNVRWISLPYAVGRLVGLVMFVGLPEELLFRGIIQESLSRLWGGRAGWVLGSVLFGLTHIVKHAPPLNWRYALLATLAGLAYGWVYRRTGRLAAAALTHGLVDWLWGTLLLVP